MKVVPWLGWKRKKKKEKKGGGDQECFKVDEGCAAKETL